MPPRIDFTSQRLFVSADLAGGTVVELDDAQSHYLFTVLRMGSGERLLAFNGRDGEWRVETIRRSKRGGALQILEQTRPQTPLNDLWLLFAPIKKERMAWMVEKAVEMGAGKLVPVLTDYTQTPRVRMDKLRAHVVEAAEQCGVLAVPDLAEVTQLDVLLAEWPADRRCLFCDEQAELADPSAVLEPLAGQPLAVLIGPEGGFSPRERDQLLAHRATTAIALGPRILRSDTAAVAALTLVQSTTGDWNERFTI